MLFAWTAGGSRHCANYGEARSLVVLGVELGLGSRLAHFAVAEGFLFDRLFNFLIFVKKQE